MAFVVTLCFTSENSLRYKIIKYPVQTFDCGRSYLTPFILGINFWSCRRIMNIVWGFTEINKKHIRCRQYLYVQYVVVFDLPTQYWCDIFNQYWYFTKVGTARQSHCDMHGATCISDVELFTFHFLIVIAQERLRKNSVKASAFNKVG